jgi:hypothetical protein
MVLNAVHNLRLALCDRNLGRFPKTGRFHDCEAKLAVDEFGDAPARLTVESQRQSEFSALLLL